MTVYSIPALTMENQFIDLVYVAGYVDHLVKISSDYATVYRWDGHSIDGPPDAVLLRVGSTWQIVHKV
jgi:hypothetical protein